MNKKKQTPIKQATQTEHTLPTPNRRYKDTLFRMIFREKDNLLPLYNALNGTHYTDSQSAFCNILQWDRRAAGNSDSKAVRPIPETGSKT